MDRVPLGPETNRAITQSRVIEVREREREAWLWVGVVAQWHSTGGLS